jgi:hypothetical protein
MHTDENPRNEGRTTPKRGQPYLFQLIIFVVFHLCESVFICGFKLLFVHRTNVSSAGPVPLTTCKYAMVSPA